MIAVSQLGKQVLAPAESEGEGDSGDIVEGMLLFGFPRDSAAIVRDTPPRG